MIGLFDTGHGGLTIYKALSHALPQHHFVYFGDHAYAPYGTKSAAEILKRTQAAVELLFEHGCTLVVLACNTATAIALRTLQQQWLPHSPYASRRILGIIVPTVEIATATMADHKRLAVFGTPRTIESGVYVTEIHKRNPSITVIPQICPHLAGAIESGADEAVLDAQVREAVYACLKQSPALDFAILGCTHFPLVEHLFRKYFPASLPLLSQGKAVAEKLVDYLQRHPEFNALEHRRGDIFLTSADPVRVTRDAMRFLGMSLPFEACVKNTTLI